MNYRSLEERIGSLEGVEAARVVAANGHIDEIHVLARRDKAAKQVVRDVQTLGHVLFGVTIDRRIVSVVQLSDADLEGGMRPALVDVSESVDGSRAEVTVTLRWHDSLLLGRVVGAAANATKPRLVAEATTAALRQAISGEVALAISSMDVPTLGNRRMAIAQVVMVEDTSERLLIGCAYVEEDESRAVVRAVLDALNRFLPSLRSE